MDDLVVDHSYQYDYSAESGYDYEPYYDDSYVDAVNSVETYDDYYDYGHENDYKAKPKHNHRHRDLVKSGSGSYGRDCCPHVVDPLLFTAILAGIAVVTFLLNQSITMNIMGRRKRSQNSFIYAGWWQIQDFFPVHIYIVLR